LVRVGKGNVRLRFKNFHRVETKKTGDMPAESARSNEGSWEGATAKVSGVPSRKA